ncbi:MAG: iron-sulfur cluster assembly protein, partial [Bacteroidaceae bacterium]|nr:iron-sulfur cluster assembly protein [Bacteroidaceae bacterium]
MTKYEVEEKTVEYLKTVFDPEIPVNVWDLGMIYKIDVTPHIAPSDSPK